MAETRELYVNGTRTTVLANDEVTVRELYINGVLMPTPALNGVTISSNKVWSANTGRTTTGKMVGTIVCVKHKIAIKWPPLTEAQAAVIEAAVSDTDNPFVPVQYTDMAGNTVTYTMYFGDVTYTQYSWSEGLRYIMDVAVDGIEQ